MRQRVFHSLMLAAVFSVACGDSTGLEAVTGTYVATQFNLIGTTTTDVLASGGSITTTLNADGSTTGTLFVPAALNQGVDLTADLAGTFTVNGQALFFSHAVNTFMSDITWIIEPSRLRGTGGLGGSTVSVVLTRQ